jgi:RNA recognition motif-containing protein
VQRKEIIEPKYVYTDGSDQFHFQTQKEIMSKIYVGNLPFTASEDDIRQLFAPYGNVTSVSLITDRETGAPRGFGFVEMEEGAREAISALDNRELSGRNLKVNEAKPKENSGGPRRARW